MKRTKLSVMVFCISVVFALPGPMELRAQDANGMVLKNSAPSEFHATPIMPPCFLGAMQRMNRETGAAVFLVRVDAKEGCVVPSHWHTSGEQITVVSGVVTVKMSDGKSFDLKEGGYAYIPSKHVHLFSCSGPCVHFVQSDGPYDIHYVNKDGKEIPLAEAMKAGQ
jgi:quercetin dioxygenase-like cupin family protein